jgi:hypothetical protein
MTVERLRLSLLLKEGLLILCLVLIFSIGARAQNPAPFINSISPVAAAPGGGNFMLTVNGAGFVPGAVVNWKVGLTTTPLAFTLVSGTKLTATVPASLIGRAVTASITVQNPASGGGVSNAMLLPVTVATNDVHYGPAIPLAPASAVAVGDFNGDGFPDIAALLAPQPPTPCTTPGTVTILINNGDGSFTSSPVTLQVGLQPSAITVGDFNGDGKQDIAVLNGNHCQFVQNGTVNVFLGNGDGTFTPAASPSSTGSGYFPIAIAAGDFNGDGRLDLAVVNSFGQNSLGQGLSTGSIAVMLGNGDGTFSSAAFAMGTGTNPNAGQLVIGDFDGDGNLDLAVSTLCGLGQQCPLGLSNIGDVELFKGNGDGTFALAGTAASAQEPSGIASGNFTDPGSLDLAISSDGFEIPGLVLFPYSGIWRRSPGGPGFFLADPDRNIVNDGSSTSVAVGDFNGDGNLDFALDGPAVALTNGPGTFAPSPAFGVPSPGLVFLEAGVARTLAATDLNGDGRLDLIFLQFQESGTFVSVMQQQPADSLSATSYSFPPQPVGAASATAVFTLSNLGAVPISLTSFRATGDFAETDNCGAALAPSASCNINVTFTPSDSGTRMGTVSFVAADGVSRTKQFIEVSGLGVPVVTLSASSLGFGNQQLGTNSATQVLTLSTNGALNIAGIVISGGNSGNFSIQANSCAAKLAKNSGCAITVVFVPSAIGARAATLNISDDGVGGPHSISLTGNGADFTIAASPTSQMTSPPGVASYTVNMASLSNYAGSLTLGCTGGPPNATCTFTPNTVALGDSASATLTVRLIPAYSYQGTFLLTVTAQPAIGLSHSATVVLETGKLQLSPDVPVVVSGSAVDMHVLRSGTAVPVPVQSWTSSNPVIAAVDANGRVSTFALGSATITAAVEGAHVSTVVNVIGISSVGFIAQPSGTPVLAPINPAVKVLVLDTNGRPVPGFAMAMALGPNPPNPAAIGGTLTQVTDATGVATFPDLTLDFLGAGYTLQATVNTPIGAFTGISSRFDELRIGDPCLAPEAATSSILSCPDTDGDGLPDAWETAGGIDVNGDGKIGSKYDVLLPGADPNKADVYLHYDYAVAGDHDHNPPAQAMQYIVEAFARHGVNLHIDPQHNAISESVAKVVQLSDPPNFTSDPACVGPHGLSMFELRQKTNFGARKFAYHYMFFSHYSECDPATDPATGNSYCSACGTLSAENDRCGPPQPPFGNRVGISEIYGDDAIVSTGVLMDIGIPIASVALELWAGLSMHEFGHNLGLRHGGADCINGKPNYVGVMNYDFYLDGIAVAASPGDTVPKSCGTDSDCPSGAHCSTRTNTCFRVDYSDRAFNTLDETNLDETTGLQGGADDTDLSFRFHGGSIPDFFRVPTNGTPIDWNGDGTMERGVTFNIIGDPFQPLTTLQGQNDWATSNGLFTNLQFNFQKSGGNFDNDGGSGGATARVSPSQPALPGSNPCNGAAAAELDVDRLLQRYAAESVNSNYVARTAHVVNSSRSPLRKKANDEWFHEPRLWP